MNEKMLARIAALLEKAESSEFGPESEALIAKAQELATLYSIDLARAELARPGPAMTPIQETIQVWPRGKQGGKYYVHLFGVIAHANDVRYNVSTYSDWVHAFGFASDVEQCQRLFVSLSVQMAAGADSALRRGAHRTAGRDGEGVDARIFRASFYEVFRETIGERLREARAKAVAKEDERVRKQAKKARKLAAATGVEDVPVEPVSSGALVLADKAAKVGAFYKQTSQARGSYRSKRAAASSPAARRAGRQAAKDVRLAPQSALPGERVALGA